MTRSPIATRCLLVNPRQVADASRRPPLSGAGSRDVSRGRTRLGRGVVLPERPHSRPGKSAGEFPAADSAAGFPVPPRSYAPIDQRIQLMDMSTSRAAGCARAIESSETHRRGVIMTSIVKRFGACLASLVMGVAANAYAQPCSTHLAGVGPIDQQNGFPEYYIDSNDLALGPCLDLDCDPGLTVPDP